MKKQSDKEVKSIIKKYKKIYHFFFNYIIYIIVWVLSLIYLFIYQFNKDYSIKLNTPKKSNIIWLNLNKDWNQIVWNMLYYVDGISFSWIDLKLKAVRWYYFYTGSKIYLQDVVGQLNWYLLPYETSFDSNINLSKYESNKKYTLEEFDYYIKNIIASNFEKTSKKFPSIVFNNSINSLIDNSIKKTFFLDCLDGGTVIDSFCRNNIDKLINYGYQYNISSDIPWLMWVYDSSKKYWLENWICKLWLNYFYYNFDVNSSFSPLMKKCGGEYENIYNYLLTYKSVHDEISSWKFSKEVVSLKDINAFKLLSIIRQIYVNSLWTNKNFDLMNRYWDYLKTLLANPGLIDNYYLQLAFVFNNKYLKWILDWLDKNQSQQIQENRAKILAMIDELNKWNDYIWDWYKWLLASIDNDEIKSLINVSVNNISIIKEDINKSFSNYISQYSYFTPFDIKIDSTKNLVNMSWKIVLTNKVWRDSITKIINDLKVSFQYDWLVFRPISISIPSNKKVTDTINSFLSKSSKSAFDDVYQNLLNLVLLTDSSQKSICDDLWEFVSQARSIQINSCDKSSVSISKWIVNYKFTYDDAKLLSYEISDVNVKNSVDKDLQWKVIVYNMISKYIISIVQGIEVKDGSDISVIPLHIQWTIRDKFTSYLWAEWVDIKPWDKRYVVLFKLDQTQYQVDLFTWENYKINNLKILYYRPGSKQAELIPIANLSLNLIESQKLALNKFKDDTENYLKTLDPTWYAAYLKKANTK